MGSLFILSGFSLRSELFLLYLGGLSLRSKPLSLSTPFLTKEKEKEERRRFSVPIAPRAVTA
jgi:hypothetical protein